MRTSSYPNSPRRRPFLFGKRTERPKERQPVIGYEPRHFDPESQSSSQPRPQGRHIGYAPPDPKDPKREQPRPTFVKDTPPVISHASQLGPNGKVLWNAGCYGWNSLRFYEDAAGAGIEQCPPMMGR